ncbi:MAG: DNA-processing protein DprA, partial [Boseongicola sp.]|nr:DNA-processing protein DprA [Boseongicola sp.]
TEEEWLDWLRLLRSRRVGISTFFRLMTEHGSAAAALDALPGVAHDAGVKNYAAADLVEVAKEWSNAKTCGAHAVAIGQPEYPDALAEISDPPPILWTLGRIELASTRCIALVGARNASSLGTRMARKLARELGEAGFTVVSGLARGVDTAAHLAALESGTIAVQAGGVDVVYPAENAVLAQEIENSGLRISEMPVHVTPQARHFPRRNRLVSGLSEAVVVIEAAAKSGSLITARTALDQGRDVMAVPGHPFDARSAGSNMLLRDGATLVRSARDVVDALERLCATEDAVAEPQRVLPLPAPDIVKLHQMILDRIGPNPVPEDQVIRDLKFDAQVVSPEIVTLEVEGRLRRDAGGMLSRIV